MREEIVAICVAALRAAGHDGVTTETIWREPEQRMAFLALLRDCRPLPVIRELIAELETGEAARRPRR